MKPLITILAIQLSAITAYGGTTIDHGLHGFLFGAVVAKAFGADKSTCYAVGGVSAFLGMLPDLAGACGNARGDNWRTYGAYHRGELAISFLPPVRLHLWVDTPFHGGGGDWWPRKWQLCAMMWAIEVIVTVVVLWWINEEE